MASRVRRQVEDRQLELVGIGLDGRQALPDVDNHPHPRAWRSESYIQGVSISQISRDFDIAPTSIKARAEKQQWVKLSHEEIEETAQAKLHAVHSVSTGAEIVDKVADARAHMIQKHQRAWDKLY